MKNAIQRFANLLTLALVLALTFAFASPGHAQSNAAVGWVASLSGPVSFSTGAAGTPVPMKLGQEINTGMTITTGPNAAVRLLMKGDNVLTVSQNSKITITQYLVGPAKSVSTFDLLVGRIRAAVASKIIAGSGSLFEIHTKNGVAGVRGSLLGVDYNPNTNTTTAGCGDGECYLKVGNQFIPIPVDQVMTIVGDKVGGPAPLKNGQPGSYKANQQYDGQGGGNNTAADDLIPYADNGEDKANPESLNDQMPTPDFDPLLLDNFKDGPTPLYNQYGGPFQGAPPEMPHGNGSTHGPGE